MICLNITLLRKKQKDVYPILYWYAQLLVRAVLEKKCNWEGGGRCQAESLFKFCCGRSNIIQFGWEWRGLHFNFEDKLVDIRFWRSEVGFELGGGGANIFQIVGAEGMRRRLKKVPAYFWENSLYFLYLVATSYNSQLLPANQVTSTSHILAALWVYAVVAVYLATYFSDTRGTVLSPSCV